MNWRRGLFRVWTLASLAWASGIIFLQAHQIFWVVHVDDLFGKGWPPSWASLTTHVQPYADTSLWSREGAFPPGTDLSPSRALIAARVGDLLIQAAAPPLLFLLFGFGVLWIVRGFQSTPKGHDNGYSRN